MRDDNNSAPPLFRSFNDPFISLGENAHPRLSVKIDPIGIGGRERMKLSPSTVQVVPRLPAGENCLIKKNTRPSPRRAKKEVSGSNPPGDKPDGPGPQEQRKACQGFDQEGLRLHFRRPEPPASKPSSIFSLPDPAESHCGKGWTWALCNQAYCLCSSRSIPPFSR